MKLVIKVHGSWDRFGWSLEEKGGAVEDQYIIITTFMIHSIIIKLTNSFGRTSISHKDNEQSTCVIINLST